MSGIINSGVLVLSGFAFVLSLTFNVFDIASICSSSSVFDCPLTLPQIFVVFIELSLNPYSLYLLIFGIYCGLDQCYSHMLIFAKFGAFFVYLAPSP